MRVWTGPRITTISAYCQKKRDEGKSHGCALRCLGQRWLKILTRMRRTGKPYDESLHLHDQLKRGAWTLTLGCTPSDSCGRT